MKAIVLTYDKYHQIADHMIHRYMTLWPDNPFVFRVPYQRYPNFLEEKYQDKVECIPTASNIKATLLSLMEDLSDDEWIYWCMDDRYPIRLKTDDVLSIYEWILNMAPDDISGVMFSNFHKMMRIRNIMPANDCIYDTRGRKYYRRKNYAMIWMHQFLRVKVLRELFNGFPDEFHQAKQMDYFKMDMSLPDRHKLFMYSKSIAVYGESTHRGKMTLNCANSFKDSGLAIPSGFEIKNKEIYIRTKNRLVTYLKYRIEQLIALIHSPV